MKYLITGGNGFIGTNLIYHLLSKKNNFIVNIDYNNYSGKQSPLNKLKSNRYKFFKNKISSLQNKQIIKDYSPDCIINLAAESHVDRSISNPRSFFNFNVSESSYFYEYCHEYLKKKHAKIIHLSTDEVYGSSKRRKFTEDNKLDPSSPYSASKAATELYLNSLFVTFSFQTIVINCGNNFGPYQFPEKFIPRSIISLLKDEKIKVFGKGNNIRNWIYVKDHVKAIEKIALNKKINHGRFNIGSLNEVRNIDIAKKIIFKIKKDNKYDNYIDYVDDRLGHDKKYSINSSKFRRIFNWTEIGSLDYSLNETVNWYIKNKDWLKDILKKKSKFV